jgi:hypothetical protein
VEKWSRADDKKERKCLIERWLMIQERECDKSRINWAKFSQRNWCFGREFTKFCDGLIFINKYYYLSRKISECVIKKYKVFTVVLRVCC